MNNLPRLRTHVQSCPHCADEYCEIAIDIAYAVALETGQLDDDIPAEPSIFKSWRNT